MVWVQCMIHCYLSYHLCHCYDISLTSLCRLVWKHWSYRMLVTNSLSSMCLRWRPSSQFSIMQYLKLNILSIDVFLRLWEYLHSIVSSSTNRKMSLYPLFTVRPIYDDTKGMFYNIFFGYDTAGVIWDTLVKIPPQAIHYALTCNSKTVFVNVKTCSPTKQMTGKTIILMNMHDPTWICRLMKF